MTIQFTESAVESAALAWLESLGWQVKHGPEIAPGDLLAERTDYDEVVVLKLRVQNPRCSNPLGEIWVKDAEWVLKERKYECV